MNFPSRETVERLRREYPVGCRIVLDEMDDPYTKIPGDLPRRGRRREHPVRLGLRKRSLDCLRSRSLP